MNETQPLVIFNAMHECPLCGDVLRLLEPDSDPQVWDCPKGHTHLQDDCCETVYDLVHS